MLRSASLAAACVLALGALARRSPSLFQGEGGLFLLPEPSVVRAVGKSQLPLITDLYWLRAINFGTSVKTPLESRALIALGRLIADLDPNFRPPYWFVALNAPVYVDEKWVNAAETAELMERARKRFPTDAWTFTVLALNYMSYQRDYVRAAEVLSEAARIPGAPKHLGPLATRLLAAAGHTDRSRALASDLMAEAPDDETRDFFAERLKAIDLEEQLVVIDRAAERFREEQGRDPTGARELELSGYLTAPLQDPFGGQLDWAKDRGAFSTLHPERLRVHELK